MKQREGVLKSQMVQMRGKKAECVQDEIPPGKDSLRDSLLRENDFLKFIIHSFRKTMW